MRGPGINAQYSVAKPGSFPLRVALKMRRIMYQRFLTEAEVSESHMILDVGVTLDQDSEISNYLEQWYPEKAAIVAVGLDDASFLQEIHTGLRFVRANGKNLPFSDDCFDIVHSSAVLEHVGSRAEQRKFVGELVRVARRFVFITTPNRWFPVEFHTVLPLLHWLPAQHFRAILRRLGHDALSREENLNLLGRRQLVALCQGLPLTSLSVRTVRLLGWPSNLLVIGRKALPEDAR